MTHHVFVLLMGFIVAALATPDLSAQEASSFRELPVLVQLGDEVRVTAVSGVVTEGKVVKLSDSSLRLSGFQRDVSSSEILQIESIKKDPLSNGIGIGMLVGLGTAAAVMKSGCSGSSGFLRCSDFPGAIAAVLGISAAVGGGIGASIDAKFVKRESVYRASKQTSRLYIVPQLAGRSRGVQLLVRF